ncbi:RNA polymerase sigma factor [Euzebya sp.]|uniref:RNA polymerase sigma factor n=1 Tax=Euzebya sp. TaxID=1971409 RepID=UPI003514172D
MTSAAGDTGPDTWLRGSNHLQPDNGADNDDWLLSELAKVEDLETSRALQRQAEAEILTVLQMQGFDTRTPEYKSFAKALIDYGYGVFMAWMITGSVRRMMAAHGGGRGVYGMGKIPEGLQLQGDDACEVVAELMIAAVTAFRDKTLMHPNPAKRWTPAGGASLKTFFVGRCFMELPNVYIRWERDQRRANEQIRNYAKVDVDHNDLAVDPSHSVETKVDVDASLAAMPPDVQAMFRLRALGYSYEEIAELMTTNGRPTTVSQVGSRLNRARSAARKAS